jgi:hypothetical protein
LDDSTDPDSNQTAFFLIAGVTAGVEGSLGEDSDDVERLNQNPCP